MLEPFAVDSPQPLHPSESIRQEDPGRRLHEALSAIQGGKAEEGIGRLRALARDHPDCLNAWGNLGYVLYTLGRTREAIPCLEKAIEIQPGLEEALKLLGDCYWSLGERKKAHLAYRQIEAILPECPPSLSQRISATEPLRKRLIRRGGELGGAFIRRLPNRDFIGGLSRELLRTRRSLPGIRASGLSAFLTYLARQYLTEVEQHFPMAPCDLCGGSAFTATFFFLNQKNVRCDRCGLEFVERKPPESLDVLGDWYNQDSSIAFMEKNWHNRSFFQHRIGLMREVFEASGRPFPSEGQSAFEIGCAEGHVLKFLSDLGLRVRGIETGQKLVDYCRDHFNLDVHKSTVREWMPRPEQYDYVFAYHVLEHLEKPSELLGKAWQALKPGGVILVEVPIPDLPSLSISEQLDDLHGYGNLGHLHYFTAETMPPYFSKHGFELIGTYQYFVNTLPSGGFLGAKPSTC
ncbi:MAG: methyltransferase domain-containing protein [Candidatus Omnitrophica bacterium]|nr:methyltransferase domain-containing protein [Candidatus Omnitrophota bacterium]